MENIIARHRNLTILAVVLFAQLFGLAYQVKRNTDRGSTRLIRLWAVTLITPLEKAFVHSVSFAASTWTNYFYLRDVRQQNESLREEIRRLRLEQIRVAEDAAQARRLQALLGFKEQFISETIPAQVISTTGSEFSRGIYIDKGSRNGVRADMPVITPDGIVGKVYRVYPTSSLVLEINDSSSGAGVILENSRLQGILKGSPSGETFLANIMADEQVHTGERLLTSGGDRIYPKGLAVGTVNRVVPGGTFLTVQVKPSAQLDRLEEVLVITKVVDRSPDTSEPAGSVRAIDVLAGRLPSVPPPNPEDKNSPPPTMAELAARARQAVKTTAAQQTGNAGAPASATDKTSVTPPKPEAKPTIDKASATTVNPATKPATQGGAAAGQGAVPKPATQPAKPGDPAAKPAAPAVKKIIVDAAKTEKVKQPGASAAESPNRDVTKKEVPQ